jgi:Fis family transcriptional regulator
MSKKKTRKKTATEKRNYAKKSLANNVEKATQQYFKDLNGCKPDGLYDFFYQEVEKPFLDVVMQHTDWNITHASTMLGINRATLCSRLRKYNLD